MGIHTPADKSQVAAQGTAGRWYGEQSARLGVPVVEIERAILHGWGGHEVAALPASRAGELAGLPPADAEHEATLRKFREAPIMPMRLDHETKRRLERRRGGRR